MSVVNLKFRNNTIQLASDEPEKLEKLAEKLNVRIEEIQAQGQNVTDTKLAYIAALILESEVESLQERLSPEINSSKSNEVTDKLLSKTINQVADYINHLSDKFEKN